MTTKYTFSLIIFFLFISSFLYAQSIDEIKADRQNYIWGEGSGSTIKEADQIALADIIGQISTQVESNFEKISIDTGDKFKETVRDVLKTYSSATLKNTERIIVQNEPDAKVFRYVKRSEVAKVFESRKNKIIELAHNGEDALRNLQIADALRYFYWSQTLLRSHPDAGEIKMKTGDGTDVLLITWLPTQINQIFTNLIVKIDSIENKETYLNYLLDIYFKNEPVRNLDYTYWSGQDWTNIYSAKDGIGIVELPKTSAGSDIRMKIEYAFDGESNIDMELHDVMQKLSQVPYKTSYITVSAKIDKTEKQTTPVKQNPISVSTSDSVAVSAQTAVVATNVGTLHELKETNDKDVVMKNVMTAIAAKNYSSVQTLFTETGFQIFQKLLQYGNARVVKKPELKYFKYSDFIICRSIPMSFSFQNNNRTFVEDVVFYFDQNNKICNLAFSLSKKSVEDIAANDAWSENARMLLISFMENYKTAYALKRLDYIENIFSDDALIITGSMTKISTTADQKYLNNNIVKYNRQTKAQYIKNLQYSFKSNEFINIRFADNTVRRSGKGNEIYGIQIKQDYFSSNYGDSGYLFLLIDLTDTISPKIHVRTWQPEKNPDGSIYGLSDF